MKYYTTVEIAGEEIDVNVFYEISEGLEETFDSPAEPTTAEITSIKSAGAGVEVYDALEESQIITLEEECLADAEDL